MASRGKANADMFPLTLPTELRLGIWALLDRRSLCNASLVCHAWHELSSDNSLWREMCRREIMGVAWTPRALARNHKSWKRHFGVRLRADPLRRVVPQLLADARTRGATTETVDISIKLYYDLHPVRRFEFKKELPHTIRHAASAKVRKGRIGVLGPDGLESLRNQATELGAHYFDITHMRSFNKNRKTIKTWEVPLAAVVEEHHRSVKVALRRTPTVQVAVGHVGMSAEQLIQNVTALSAALAEVLPSWDRVGSVVLHATRGPSFTVMSAPPPRR